MCFIKKKLNKQKTGKLIMTYIAKSKLTYDEISIYLNFTSSRVIYDWVSGKKIPTIENFSNLSKLLNCKIEDLIYLE